MTEAGVRPIRLIGIGIHRLGLGRNAPEEIRLTVSLPYLKNEPLGQVVLTRRQLIDLVDESIHVLRRTEGDQ